VNRLVPVDGADKARLDPEARRWLKAEVDRRTRQRLKGEKARLRAEALLKRWGER
jgi:hypothetical protein